MFDWIKENSTAFAIAVVFHLLFLTALFFNWHFDKPDKIVLQQGDIIQVSAVDANTYDAEIRKIEQQKKAEQRKKAQAKRKAQELVKKKKQEDVRKKKEKQRKADELKRKKAADAKKKKLALKKAEQEKKRKKEAKKKKIAEEKLKKEKLKKEKLKKEQLKKEQQKKADQEKHRLEEKKKQQQAEQKRKAEADKKHQAELKRKEQRDRAEWERRSKGIIKRHVALIVQKIERNWRQPLDVPSRLECKVEIALLPSGNVISVKVIESSGNLSFDRSVETAVRKASPLPVPADSVIFKEFEVMRLRFEPGSY